MTYAAVRCAKRSRLNAFWAGLCALPRLGLRCAMAVGASAWVGACWRRRLVAFGVLALGVRLQCDLPMYERAMCSFIKTGSGGAQQAPPAPAAGTRTAKGCAWRT